MSYKTAKLWLIIAGLLIFSPYILKYVSSLNFNISKTETKDISYSGTDTLNAAMGLTKPDSNPSFFSTMLESNVNKQYQEIVPCLNDSSCTAFCMVIDINYKYSNDNYSSTYTNFYEILTKRNHISSDSRPFLILNGRDYTFDNCFKTYNPDVRSVVRKIAKTERPSSRTSKKSFHFDKLRYFENSGKCLFDIGNAISEGAPVYCYDTTFNVVLQKFIPTNKSKLNGLVDFFSASTEYFIQDLEHNLTFNVVNCSSGLDPEYEFRSNKVLSNSTILNATKRLSNEIK